MDRETMSKLRLDKRLTRRRGWISRDDLDRELEALPDVSSKIAPIEEPDGEPGTPEPEA